MGSFHNNKFLMTIIIMNNLTQPNSASVLVICAGYPTLIYTLHKLGDLIL